MGPARSRFLLGGRKIRQQIGSHRGGGGRHGVAGGRPFFWGEGIWCGRGKTLSYWVTSTVNATS